MYSSSVMQSVPCDNLKPLRNLHFFNNKMLKRLHFKSNHQGEQWLQLFTNKPCNSLFFTSKDSVPYMYIIYSTRNCASQQNSESNLSYRTYIFHFFAFFGPSRGRRLGGLTFCHLTGNLITCCHGHLEWRTAHTDMYMFHNSTQT